MKRPNFFIVGAPKCGTTALYEYLRTHPQVFLPRQKEPDLFASDLSEKRERFQTLDGYLALFEDATEAHRAIGEASSQYLFSQVAAREIFRLNPAARLIALVRNPIDFVAASHRQLLFDLQEDVEDFETAWRLQETRRRGERIPRTCFRPKLLQYSETGKLGEQIHRLLEVFPPQQVKIIIFDDFASDTRSVYLEVLRFLGLDDDGRRDFPQIHPSKLHRSRWLARSLLQPPKTAQKVIDAFKRLTGIQRTGIVAAILRRTAIKTPRAPLSTALRGELAEVFREDVELLGRLLQRDLRHWLEPER